MPASVDLIASLEDRTRQLALEGVITERKRASSRLVVSAFSKDRDDRRRPVRENAPVCWECVLAVWALRVGGAKRHTLRRYDPISRATPCELCGEPSLGHRWFVKQHAPVLEDFFSQQEARAKREKVLRGLIREAIAEESEAAIAELEVEKLDAMRERQLRDKLVQVAERLTRQRESRS